MKLKFKVGDRIRFVKSIITHSDKVQVGEAYEIIEIDSSNIPYKAENGEWFREDELELVTTTFKKTDLKDGDKCTLKNEEVVFYGGSSKYGSTYCFENLTDDFKYELNDEVSIVKVERPTYETVFERKEEILDNTEKNYLRGVIRPFRDRVKFIKKQQEIGDDEDKSFIEISVDDDTPIMLPYFDTDTMYKGMEDNKEYSLEELGLWEN